MTNFFKVYIFIFLFFFILPCSAIEFGGNFTFENLAFRWDREIGDDYSATDFCYSGSFYFNHIFQKFEQNLSMHAEYSYDVILKNSLRSMVHYNGNFFSFGVGPFVSFLNTEQALPKVGITSQFKIQIPGIIFADMGMDSTIGNKLEENGNYQQEKSFISIGFYVPNAICSFNINRKIFRELEDDMEIEDKLTYYSFDVDIFKKNVPFKIMLSFGFQSLAKTFNNSLEYTLYSVIVGTKVDVDVTDSITLTFGLDSSIYTFGQDELLGVSNPGVYLFRATTGIKFNLDKIIQERKLRGQEANIEDHKDSAAEPEITEED